MDVTKPYKFIGFMADLQHDDATHVSVGADCQIGSILQKQQQNKQKQIIGCGAMAKARPD